MISVDCLNGECGYTNRNILGPVFTRRTVPDPLAGMGDDRLSRLHLKVPTGMLNPQRASEHEGIFLESRGLSRLDPSGRALHMGNTDARCFCVYATDMLKDDLRLIAGSLDFCGGRDEDGHIRYFGPQGSAVMLLSSPLF